MTARSIRQLLGTWLTQRPYTLLTSVFLMGMAVPFIKRQDPEWEWVFLRGATQLLHGEDLYPEVTGYLYPPFMALAHIPFLYLPGLFVRRAAFFVVNVLCLVVMGRWGWRVAGGGRLEGSPPVSWREHAAAIGGFLCGAGHLQNCLAHRQTDIAIAAAIILGCILLQVGRFWSAATALGTAAACKCTPLLWAPFLAWRGRFAAAVWLVVVAGGLNLGADLVDPSPSGKPWLQAYYERYLRPLTRANHEVGSWGSDIAYNQSLSGAGQRWLTSTLSWGERDCEIRPRAERPSSLALRATVQGSELALVLFVLWGCRRPFRGPALPAEKERLGLECGIVVTLMLLFSPMSSKAHFGVLILPGFCLARAAIRLHSRVLAGMMVLAVLLAVASVKDPLGERLYTLSLWCGATTWQTLVLLVGSVLAVRWTDVAARSAAGSSAPRALSEAA